MFSCTCSAQWLFPTRLLTSEDEYKWYWHQMIYFPETINTVSTWILSTTTHSVHAGISKPWRGRLPRPVVVFSSHHVSRLISFLVRAQLTLFVPASGTGSPFPQNGVPIHRIRAHSLSRVRDSGTHYTLLFHPDTQISTQKYCTLQTSMDVVLFYAMWGRYSNSFLSALSVKWTQLYFR
jgi:hypothetical protein